MRVTEGKGTNWDRWLCVMGGIAVSAFAVVVFVVFPVTTAPAVWVAFALGAAFVVRQGLLSIVAVFCRVEPAPEAERRPSFTFIVPCLNELSALSRSLPAMKALDYEGDPTFCYVCERDSTDGSLDYLRDQASQAGRIVLVEKDTPPAGRGAAVLYGLRHAPFSEIVGFLDADHVLGQRPFDELVRLFARERPPVAVQGRCETLNRRANPLVQLLSAERRWLERVELLAGPRLGGICQFGGGQGFFRAEFLKETECPIDETMILDDTDLSVRMALDGHRIRFSPHIWTRSLQPETLSEFLDQRFRWAPGWLQLARKHFLAPLRRRRMGLATRLDLVRLITTPFAGLVLWLGFLAAAVGLTVESQPAAEPLVWACLLWPLLLGLGPLLSGALPRRPADVPLVLLGIPLLTWFYAWVCAASVVDVFVLRRAPRYAKTVKRMRDGRMAGGHPGAERIPSRRWTGRPPCAHRGQPSAEKQSHGVVQA